METIYNLSPKEAFDYLEGIDPGAIKEHLDLLLVGKAGFGQYSPESRNHIRFIQEGCATLENQESEVELTKRVAMIWQAMFAINQIEKKARQARIREGRFQPRILKPEVGRNDPCPCGSGKKFKHCCMN